MAPGQQSIYNIAAICLPDTQCTSQGPACSTLPDTDLHLGSSVHGQAEIGDGGVNGAGALDLLPVQLVQIHAVHALFQTDVQQ